MQEAAAPKPGRAKPAASKSEDDRYRAPALDKGLDILELLSEQPRGMTRGEIVKAMGRGPSEIYRMLERLVARVYVARSAEGDRYALTMKLFVLAHRHPPVRRLVTRALPLMDAFARAAQQSCHLVAPDREAGLIVAQATCPGNWEFGIRVGARIDLLATGSGLTLLAFQDGPATEETVARWAISSIEVASKPFSAKSWRETSRSCSRRCAPVIRVRAGTFLGDVTRLSCRVALADWATGARFGRDGGSRSALV